MSSQGRSRAWGLLALAGCAQTATATNGDAASALDVTTTDVPMGPCTWRVGEVREIQHMGQVESCALRDLAAAGQSVWVASVCDRGGAALPSPRVEQVQSNGRSEWLFESAGGPMPRHPISIAVDDTLGRRGALLSPMSTELVGFGPDNTQRTRTPVDSHPSSFSLGEHQRLMINRAGFTCVADQIRALWGVSMLQLDASGVAVSAVDLDITTFPPVPYERVGLPDRSFVMTWTDRERDAGAPTLRLRRYDENGVAFTREPHVLDANGPSAPHVVVAPTSAGLLALWETEMAPSSRRFLATRTLSNDGAPTRDAIRHSELGFYDGGLHATAARGDVLATVETGSGVLRLQVIVLGPDGAQRVAPLTVSMLSPIAPDTLRARIVTTPYGALVAFQRDERTTMVAPITCAP